MNQESIPEEETGQQRYKPKAIDKCFFAQKTALKIQYNEQNNGIYFGVGMKDDQSTWRWQNAKIKDTEAADIIRVIDGQSDAASFYHKYEGRETRIWVNRKDDKLSVRIDDCAKSLMPDEQGVLRIILTEAILRTSCRLSIRSGSDSASAGSASPSSII